MIKRKPPIEWRSGASRSERSALIRQALFDAAAAVVGELGYESASITLITQRAGVAQGTFYLHFRSRQDILDQLLPSLGRDMVEHVRRCASKGATFVEREELGFRGFFSFLKQAPHFFRILNEAESFAPRGYKEHLELVSGGYIRFLSRARDDGELRMFEPRDLEVVAFMLMSARTYLAWRFVERGPRKDEIPEWVVQAYMKFVRLGLEGLAESPSAKSTGVAISGNGSSRGSRKVKSKPAKRHASATEPATDGRRRG
jgi:AcrR family transcriptional regulator